ncbi:MAG: DNA/RNA nuclease SfsA [Bacillota bacterium]
MRLPPLKKAVICQRTNRFCVGGLGEDGRPVYLHLPNSGRLAELIASGREGWYIPFGNRQGKKTTGRLVLVRSGEGNLVCIDAARANDIVHEAILQGIIEKLRGYERIVREYTVGKSRFDICMFKGKKRCLVEVKSVTLVEDGAALFPDAPTLRGLKHLEELSRLMDAETKAAVLFVIQRDDALRFTPNYRTHRDFGEKLKEAGRRGVSVQAWDCRVTMDEVVLRRPMEVVLI